MGSLLPITAILGLLLFLIFPAENAEAQPSPLILKSGDYVLVLYHPPQPEGARLSYIEGWVKDVEVSRDHGLLLRVESNHLSNEPSFEWEFSETEQNVFWIQQLEGPSALDKAFRSLGGSFELGSAAFAFINETAAEYELEIPNGFFTSQSELSWMKTLLYSQEYPFSRLREALSLDPLRPEPLLDCFRLLSPASSSNP